MAVDITRFRQGMRLLCGGVTVITTRDGAGYAGLTATAVCSLSAEPPRLLACVNRAGASYGALVESGVFCVNLLSAGQEDLARDFAGMTGLAMNERFGAGDWHSLETGAPILKTALAAFECRVSSVIENGSHGIIIGDIMAIETTAIETTASTQPLLYMDGRFLTAAPLADDLRRAC